jgi:DNA-nicking Smr family endonuclease
MERETVDKIFDYRNSSNPAWRGCFLDLHGLFFEEAMKILDKMLPLIQMELNQGLIKPNFDERCHHLVKVVCGAGHHSREGQAVLKHKVPEYLKAQGYDIYTLELFGAVFVHLIKQ